MRAPTNKEPMKGHSLIELFQDIAGEGSASLGFMFNGEVKENKSSRHTKLAPSCLFP